MITAKQRVEQIKQLKADHKAIRAQMMKIIAGEDTTPAQKLEAAALIIKIDEAEGARV